jgi:GT2 family glycosyltransferase
MIPAMTPALACVVLSHGNEPGLLDAVRSLLTQEEPLEIVVVNSGGGDVEATLRRAGVALPIVTRKERLFVGAARNLGIAATHAPYVAFLATDCWALPGWASGRLREHRRGALAVSAAMVNPYEDDLAAWASHILQAARRMPATDPRRHADYGLSYARMLFARFGLFREDLPIKEDTDLNARLTAAGVAITWAPDVRTAHRYPRSVGALLRDQFIRGARDAQVIHVLSRRSRGSVARQSLARTRANMWIAYTAAGGTDGAKIRRALPLTLCGGIARTLGALLA